jgi:plastocyanin
LIRPAAAPELSVMLATILTSRTAAVAAAALAMAVGGCGSSSSGGSGSSAPAGTTTASASGAAPSGPAVQSATVTIKSFKFGPPTIVVKKGGRVKFDNADAAAHTATADDRSFDTQTIDQGKTKTVTFMTAGTIPYHCDFHPFMKGTIVVK